MAVVNRISWSRGPIPVSSANSIKHSLTTMRQTSSALSKTVELFRWVAKETAADLGYRYPDTDDERVTAWIAAHSE